MVKRGVIARIKPGTEDKVAEISGGFLCRTGNSNSNEFTKTGLPIERSCVTPNDCRCKR